MFGSFFTPATFQGLTLLAVRDSAGAGHAHCPIVSASTAPAPFGIDVRGLWDPHCCPWFGEKQEASDQGEVPSLPALMGGPRAGILVIVLFYLSVQP